MKRLWILHKLPTPNNDALFRALHSDPEIDLQVFHLWRGSARRPWKTELATGYPNYYLRPKLGVDWYSLVCAWRDRDSLFMVGDWAHTPSIALLFARIVRGFPVAIWADTPQENLHRPWWKRIPRGIFLRWLLNRINIVFGSGIPARRALIVLGAPADKIRDFQFSVDLDRPDLARRDDQFQARTIALRGSFSKGSPEVIFGMSGTVDLSKKAQDVGLHTFAKCAGQIGVAVGMLVAGDGPDMERLKKVASDFGVADRVHFLGWQEPEAMNTFYDAIDVLVHPANYDPFPLVVIESMSWGRPVVGTITSGSVEERVVEGVNGFRVKPGDVEQMAEAMEKLATDGSFLESAKIMARKKAEEWPISRLIGVVKKELV